MPPRGTALEPDTSQHFVQETFVQETSQRLNVGFKYEQTINANCRRDVQVASSLNLRPCSSPKSWHISPHKPDTLSFLNANLYTSLTLQDWP